MPTGQKTHLNYQTASYLEPAREISSETHGLIRQGHEIPLPKKTSYTQSLANAARLLLLPPIKSILFPNPSYNTYDSHVEWYEFE